MRKMWFIGCTHFEHANIIKLANRPFDNVNQMNDHMLDTWNERVKPDDDVMLLGDFAWKHYEEWLKKLHGNITWIFGNHDDRHKVRANLMNINNLVGAWDYLELPEVGPTGLVLFHYPISDWNGRYRGSLHLHAHTHDTRIRYQDLPYLRDSKLDKGDKPGDDATAWGLPDKYPKDIVFNRFCVGVEATPNYGPIELEQIVELARGAEY